MGMKRLESDDEFEELLDKFFGKLTELAKKKEEETTPRKQAQIERKLKLKKEVFELEDKLESVTNNDYVEIGEFMNEYFESEIGLLKKTYRKCKEWLDDNDMPYEN